MEGSRPADHGGSVAPARRPPVVLPLLAGLALLGLAAFLFILSGSASSDYDACIDADLLTSADCSRLYDDTASTFQLAAIAAAVVAVVGLLAYFILVRRTQTLDGREQESLAQHATDDEVGDDADAPLRVCPVCSAQSRTRSDSCPHCGSSFIRSRRLRAKRRIGTTSTGAKIAVASSVVIIALAAAAAFAATQVRNDRDDEAITLAEEEQAHRELEAEQKAAEEARKEERLERTLRQTVVNDLERSITEDAQKEAAKQYSIIDGPILDTQCDPQGGQVDTQAVTQQFSCLAIRRYTGGGGASGYRYSASVNYNSFSYRWRLGGGGV